MDVTGCGVFLKPSGYYLVLSGGEPSEIPNQSGIIVLCSEKDDAVVEYALGETRANVFASKYLSALPDKETLRQEILRTKRVLAMRAKKER